MQGMLEHRFHNEHSITKIIPNFYRNTKAHDAFILAFSERFPGRVAATALPFDSVFDTLVKEHKILFVHRLSSKVAAFYIKLIHELFGLDEETTWHMVMEKRTQRLNSEATGRLTKLRREMKEEKSQNDEGGQDMQEPPQPSLPLT
jgi:hypothetical protein